MGRGAYRAAAGLAAAILLLPVGAHANDVQKAPSTLEGRYVADVDTKNAVTITLFGGDAYHVTGPQWEGVGFFDGKNYWGVFRLNRRAGSSESTAVSGTHHGTLRPDGSLAVHGEYSHGRTGSFETVWKPEHVAPPPDQPGLPVPRFEHPVWPPETPPESEGLPKLGDSVYVEELPEALTKVAPVYPAAAREAKIEGTVLIQALVGRDGRVKDTRVVHSVTGLDDAAVESVRQWVFKPALAKAKPVAVWVAVPVRFSLR